MGCGDKKKNRCGTPTSSACARYELDIPDFSELSGEECLSIEDTTEDLYNITEKLFNSTDLSDLDNTGCIEYEENDDGEIDVKEAIAVHREKIIELLKNAGLCDDCDNSTTTTGTTSTTTTFDPDVPNTTINPNLDITSLGLDLRCYVDPCGDPITTLKQLLQLLINEKDC